MHLEPMSDDDSHNPYFNRWFSAIEINDDLTSCSEVTILILIDGFLQSEWEYMGNKIKYVTILILIDGFLQY